MLYLPVGQFSQAILASVEDSANLPSGQTSQVSEFAVYFPAAQKTQAAVPNPPELDFLPAGHVYYRAGKHILGEKGDVRIKAKAKTDVRTKRKLKVLLKALYDTHNTGVPIIVRILSRSARGTSDLFGEGRDLSVITIRACV